MPLNTGEFTFAGGGGFRGDRSNTVRIEGDDAVIARLFALPGNIGKKHLRRVVKSAMRPMKSQLLANTPQGPSGNLRMAVADKVAIYPSGVVFGIVGYKRTVSVNRKDARGFHSHLLEFGTAERRPTRSQWLSSQSIRGWRPPGWQGRWPMKTRRTRGARAQEPMRRAYQAAGSQAAGLMESGMLQALNDAVGEAGGGES